MAQVISLSEAAVLSNNELVEGIVADIISVDEWFRYLPFVVFEGLAYTFTRERTLAAADFATTGTNLNAAKYQSGSTFSSVNVNLTAILAEIIIDGQLEDQLSDHNDQLQVQISGKAKQLARIYMNAVVNANRGGALVQANNGPIGLADRFKGMASILDAEQGNADDVNHPFYNSGATTQTLTLEQDDPASARNGLEGRVYTLEDLDDLIDRITAASPDFLMMHSRDIRTLRVLLRNTGGGTDAGMIQTQGLGSEKPMLMYQGIPVFRNDYVSRYDAVNTQAKALVIATSNATTIKLTVAGDATEKSALMRGSDGVLYRWDISAGAGTTTLTVASTGSFMDPEQNKLVARIAPNNAVFADAQLVTLAERTDGSSIYCGCWGEYKGIVGFTSANNAGLKLEYVGPRENENAYQYRMKWYCGFDLYNRLSLARMAKVLPLGA